MSEENNLIVRKVTRAEVWNSSVLRISTPARSRGIAQHLAAFHQGVAFAPLAGGCDI
jgi:hypothetical protein